MSRSVGRFFRRRRFLIFLMAQGCPQFFTKIGWTKAKTINKCPTKLQLLKTRTNHVARGIRRVLNMFSIIAD